MRSGRRWPLSRIAHFSESSKSQFAISTVCSQALAAAGVWWAYPLLWLVPLLAWMMVISRIRNIARARRHSKLRRSLAPPHHARTFSSGCSSHHTT